MELRFWKALDPRARRCRSLRGEGAQVLERLAVDAAVIAHAILEVLAVHERDERFACVVIECAACGDLACFGEELSKLCAELVVDGKISSGSGLNE